MKKDGVFLFLTSFFPSRDIQVFSITQIRYWWHHKLCLGESKQSQEYLSNEWGNTMDN